MADAVDGTSGIAALAPIIGLWQTVGTTLATAGGPAVPFGGTDRYDWLMDQRFILHSVDVMMGDQPSIGVETIWFDPQVNVCRLHAVDHNGNASMAVIRRDGRTWSSDGAAERFRGTFSDDWNSLAGRWERRDVNRWVPWMDVTLTRAG